MNEYLLGIYKEVGKNPEVIKIKNQKEYLEKLLDGEIATLDYDDYTIIYKKASDNLLANVYVSQYSKIGISLKGKIFAVGKDENGNFKSLNKEQAKRCITHFLKESFNYKNFDENGKYIPKSKKKSNKKIFNNSKSQQIEQPTSEEKKQVNAVQENKPPTSVKLNDIGKALNVGNQFFESKFRVEKVDNQNQNNNASNSNENQKSDKKEQHSTNDSPPPVIKLSDEDTLNMILKITFIILDFVRGALEDSNEDE